MLRWTVLRMMLLLWMTRVTLQGGTGYGLGPNNQAAKMKGNGYGSPPASGNYGQGASLPPSNGNQAKFKGYGQASAAAEQKGYGAKPNAPAVQNAYGGKAANYGAVSAVSNGQGAKANGAYGNTQSKPGYKGHTPYGGIGMGMGMMNQQASKQRGGYGNGRGYGSRAPDYGGYRNLLGTHPQNGASLGYNAGHGADKGQNSKSGGYGVGPGAPNGPGTKSNGYGGAKGPSAGSSLGYTGYPNSGFKGPKPGYGTKAGPSNGQGAKPNGYGLGPNNQAAKMKGNGYGSPPASGNYGQGASLPPSNGNQAKFKGYGQASAAANQKGYGAKPNGYGVFPGMSKGPYNKAVNSGYGPTKNGKGGVSSRKGPKGETLSPNAQSHLPVLANTKGVVPQGIPSKSFVQGPSSYKPGKAYKPVAPAPVVPQSKASKPVAPIVFQEEAAASPKSAPIPQGKLFPQVPQNVALGVEKLFPQKQNTAQVVPQPQSGISSPVSLVPGPQSKPNPAFPQPMPETQQAKIPPALQPNHAVTQVKNPATTNPELAGLGETNGQQQAAKPAKPDCGPGGRPKGQWIKLPSPGSMYPKQNGAKQSQAGVPGMRNGYKGKSAFGAGQGSYPSAEYGNGNGQAFPDVAVKGKPGNVYGHGSAGPQGGQPTEVGSKGKSQTKYGIGGRVFGGSPNGYQPNPYGKYGNNGLQYGAKPYNAKAGYGSLSHISQPLGLESVAQSPGYGGVPYNNQPFRYSDDKFSGKYGFGGLPYGGQPLGLGSDAKSGKYGESNPAVPYELFGPVTDGQSVEENRNLETLHQGPEIDGHKSIDHFGDGEVPPHPDNPVILASAHPPTKSTYKYETGDHTNERMQPEVVSFPAAPTEGPAPHIPAITSSDSAHLSDSSSLSQEALVSVPVMSAMPDVVSEVSAVPVPPQAELPTLMFQPAAPQQIHIQQQLKFHLHPHGKSQTGGKEGKYNLNGFFGNKYQG